MSQYDLTITYIHGEDNTVADALSQLPPDCFPEEMPALVLVDSVNAVLTITADRSILDTIKARYLDDEFCKCVVTTSMKGWQMTNRLWYIGERLLIPQVTDIRESLFKMAHDSLGHFGVDKLYASLQNAYYWPNM